MKALRKTTSLQLIQLFLYMRVTTIGIYLGQFALYRKNGSCSKCCNLFADYFAIQISINIGNARSTKSITKSSLRTKIFYKNVIRKSVVNDLVDVVIVNKKYELDNSTSC